MNKIEIKSEEIVYDGYLKIEEGKISETDKNGNETQYSRFRVNRPDAAAVVLYNSDNDTVVLVKQHRYAVSEKFQENMIEIVAGKVDGNENHRDTVKREVKEEVGYEVKEENLLYISSFFASPGYSSEMIHVYAATVNQEDKVSDGGGVQGEHENIEILNIPAPEFFNMFVRGEIIDAKSIIGANALWHIRNQKRVEIGLEYYEKSLTNKSELNDNQNANEAS